MKEVTVELGGKERKLIYDFNALAKAEEVTGKSMLDGAVWQSPSATDLRAFIWAGLLRDDPNVTIQQVGSWLTIDTMSEITGYINEALDISTTEADGDPLASTESSGLSPGLTSD